jgi:hypothetical protein
MLESWGGDSSVQKTWGLLLAAAGALLLCDGDVRCAVRKLIAI